MTECHAILFDRFADFLSEIKERRIRTIYLHDCLKVKSGVSIDTGHYSYEVLEVEVSAKTPKETIKYQRDFLANDGRVVDLIMNDCISAGLKIKNGRII